MLPSIEIDRSLCGFFLEGELMKIGAGTSVAIMVVLMSSIFPAVAQPRKLAPASEPGINPQCMKMSNKRGCTCAVETGGTVANGRWQYFNSRTYSDCMQKKGWL
jgi:hypothetical protein